MTTEQFRDFDEYREFVKFLAENKISLDFPNSSSKHAAVVLANIFETSKNVYIYDSNLKGDIAYEHEDFINGLKNFCEKGDNNLYIILKSDKDLEKQKLYQHIKTNKSDRNANVKLFIHNDDFKNSIIEATKKEPFKINSNINFTVSDNAYRIERFDTPAKYDAVCNLYNPEKANILLSVVSNFIENNKLKEISFN